jgi:YD repeat-containing protein
MKTMKFKKWGNPSRRFLKNGQFPRVAILTALLTLGLGASSYAQTVLSVNSGGSAFERALGAGTKIKIYEADASFTNGTVVTTTNAIDSTNEDILYQDQRVGANFSYSIPVPNASYTVRFLFAEIQGKAVGERKFTVNLNTKDVLTDFDIAQKAGGANSAFERSFPVTVTNGKIDINFTGTTGEATIAAIQIIPVVPVTPLSVTAVNGISTNFLTLPDWLAGTIPSDESDAPGDGPSSAISVSLPTGVVEVGATDIVAENPEGSDVAFSREYRTALAAAGVSSPSFPKGWTHNFDLRIVPSAGNWDALSIVYPTGAREPLTPVLNSGTPTGVLTPDNGAPYVASGVAGATAGEWASITLTSGGEAKQVFTKVGSVYRPTQVVAANGKKVNIAYDAGGRVTSVTNEAGTILLQFTYTGSSLTKVTDKSIAGQELSVSYTFALPYRTLGVPLGVYDSQDRIISGVYKIYQSTSTTEWLYGYVSVGGKWLLNSVKTGGGAQALVAANVAYDTSTGKAQSVTDANGNKREYVYNADGSTTVTAKGPDGVVVDTGTSFYDGTLRGYAGKSSAGDVITSEYGAASNPAAFTKITTPLGHSERYVIDDKGNPIHYINARGLGTQLTWDYSIDAFPFGLLKQVQEGGKTPTKYEYFTTTNLAAGEIAGNVKSTFTPKPGATSGTQIWVEKKYTYTPLGNIKTITTPAASNSATDTTTTTYEYSTDGNYSRTEELGRPVSVTDALGNVTHYRYDERKRLSSVIDPMGNRTDYSYNEYDQLTEVQYPPAIAGQGRIRMVYTYPTKGKPATKVQLFDATGAVFREISTESNAEWDPKKVLGDAMPVSQKLDPQYQLKEVVAGTTVKHQFEDKSAQRQFVTRTGGDATTTNFDANGAFKDVIDPKGQTISVTRATDDLRMVVVTQPGLGDASYEHDIYGRVTKRKDASGTQEYTYDDLDNILSVATTYKGMTASAIGDKDAQGLAKIWTYTLNVYRLQLFSAVS